MKKVVKNAGFVSLFKDLESVMMSAFEACGYDREFGRVTRSKLPELAHYQANGCFAVAKKFNIAPMEVAEKVAGYLQGQKIFRQVIAIKPGFVNMFLADEYLLEQVKKMIDDETITFPVLSQTRKVIIDYGGANIAKPLHVGHLRPAIIGESLKRIGRFVGCEVISDVHLGDWGLQMGMVITELKRLKPDLPYFDSEFVGEYPKESPVTVADLDKIYPEASQRAKSDEAVMNAARQATVELQDGRRGYHALWQHIVNVSVADLKNDYRSLGVEFDLWLGESHANDIANHLIVKMIERGDARESDGAVIMEVGLSGDVKEIPPLMLKNSTGGLLYGATDLATIEQRVKDYSPDEIIYVVDKRQSLHLEQVFRAARKVSLVRDHIKLEHVDFGTMNGKDNKPFKTRAGGTIKLKELIALIVGSAMDRLKDTDHDFDQGGIGKNELVRRVGVATLKFADLSNYRANDYIFDLERFSSFEGRTGPYLLYSITRANSILKKAEEQSVCSGEIILPANETERDLFLTLLELPEAISSSWEAKSPKLLCDFAYDLAGIFSRFYHECPVLSEKDARISSSRLALVENIRDVLTLSLDLLGIEAVEKM